MISINVFLIFYHDNFLKHVFTCIIPLQTCRNVKRKDLDITIVSLNWIQIIVPSRFNSWFKFRYSYGTVEKVPRRSQQILRTSTCTCRKGFGYLYAKNVFSSTQVILLSAHFEDCFGFISVDVEWEYKNINEHL